MKVVASGHGVDLNPDMRQTFVAGIEAVSEKFDAGMTSAHLIVKRGPHNHGFCCEITGHFPGNKTIVASAEVRDDEINQAYLAALSKFETQVRKLHRAPSHLKLVDSDS